MQKRKLKNWVINAIDIFTISIIAIAITLLTYYLFINALDKMIRLGL